MAGKRATIGDDLFKATGGDEPVADIPATGYIRSTSVGLRESEVAILDGIAESYGLARNAIMRYMLRWAMAKHQAGELTIPVREETRRTLDMP